MPAPSRPVSQRGLHSVSAATAPRIGPQDARPEREGHDLGHRRQPPPLGIRKTRLRPDQDGPGPALRPGSAATAPARCSSHHISFRSAGQADSAGRGPAAQRPRGTTVAPHCSAASTACAWRRSCRTRVGIGMGGLHRHYPPPPPSSTAFSTMKIGPRLLHRREQQPQVRRHPQRRTCARTETPPRLPASATARQPLAVAPVEQCHPRPGGQPPSRQRR